MLLRPATCRADAIASRHLPCRHFCFPPQALASNLNDAKLSKLKVPLVVESTPRKLIPPLLLEQQ